MHLAEGEARDEAEGEAEGTTKGEAEGEAVCDRLLRSVHQTEPGVVCPRMDAERPLMCWQIGGERPLARPLMSLL